MKRPITLVGSCVTTSGAPPNNGMHPTADTQHGLAFIASRASEAAAVARPYAAGFLLT